MLCKCSGKYIDIYFILKITSFPTGVFCHLSQILEHKIRCFLVILLVFTMKIDEAVFFTYLRLVHTISNLQSFSNPPTLRAGLKLDGVEGKLGILGFFVQIFILPHYVNVL